MGNIKTKRKKQVRTGQRLMAAGKLFVIVMMISCLLFLHVMKGWAAPGEIAEIARTQVGNFGGRPYWSWYGFDRRVDWCCCFISWCIYKSGLEEPKFSVCDDGVKWFTDRNRWQGKETHPESGMIIFFDGDGDGISDHAGIVIKCEKDKIYTVEGNEGDKCREKEYFYGEKTIIGYGVI